MPANAKITVIGKGKLPKIADPAAAVRRALMEPIGAPPLSELARGRKSACILICDITRPVPNHLFLRPMIETWSASGVPLDKIDVLVATGLHRPNDGEELAELVGDPWVMSTCASKIITRGTKRITSISASHARAAHRSSSTGVSSKRIAHRHRAGRASFHGGMVRRPQGRRARRRPP